MTGTGYLVDDPTITATTDPSISDVEAQRLTLNEYPTSASSLSMARQ